MKILGQPLLQVFQTRKKLSNAKYVHWIIALFVLIGLGQLFIMIEFVKMFDRKVLYYNLKTVHINKENQNSNMSVFQNNSPLFVIYEDKIVFGSVQSLVLPKLKKDSLVLNYDTFVSDFKTNIASYKNYKNIFPAQVIGIAFEPNWKRKINYETKLKTMDQIYNLVKQENDKSYSTLVQPSMVFVDTLSF